MKTILKFNPKTFFQKTKNIDFQPKMATYKATLWFKIWCLGQLLTIICTIVIIVFKKFTQIYSLKQFFFNPKTLEILSQDPKLLRIWHHSWMTHNWFSSLHLWKMQLLNMIRIQWYISLVNKTSCYPPVHKGLVKGLDPITRLPNCDLLSCNCNWIHSEVISTCSF